MLTYLKAALTRLDRDALYLLIAIVVAGIINFPSILVYFGLIAYLLLHPTRILLVLLLVFTLNMGASPLFPASDLAGRWLVLFAVFGVALFSRSIEFRGAAIAVTLAFVGFAVLTGAFLSKMPLVSVMKGVALGMLLLSVLSAVKSRHPEFIERQATTVFAVILGSSLLVFSVGSGFEVNDKGFQGSLVHPQVMGSFAAIASAWFCGRWFLSKEADRLEKLLALLALIMLYGSQSRTGALGLLFGYGLMVIAAPIAGRRPGRFIPRADVVLVLILVISLGFVLGDFSERATTFLQKGDEVNLAIDDVLVASRGELMGYSIRNFREHPWFGIGLGVPSFYDSAIIERFVVRFQGIPISASVEKGFMPTAALEEVGLIGTVLVGLLLFIITIIILRNAEAWVIWVFMTAMLQNAGEAVLFSPGGKGLLIWVVVGFCYMMARRSTHLSRSPAVPPLAQPIGSSSEL